MWKIADFGLTSPGNTSSPVITIYARGKAGYRAPELLRNPTAAEFTKKTDIWSIGCILYEISAGHPPFSDDYAVDIYGQSKHKCDLSLSIFDDFVNRRATRLLRACLHATRDRRPSARAASDAIEDFAALVSSKNEIIDLQRQNYTLKSEISELVSLIVRDDAGDRTGKDGGTPLHWAAGQGRVEAIKALKAAGADVMVKDGDGRTPMHCAAEKGHVSAIRALKEAGGVVTAKDAEGKTPMHCAARNGHIDAIRILKAEGGDLIAKDEFGKTPMHWAAEKGYVKAIDVLKEAGGDVTSKDAIGWTAMHWAAAKGHADMIKALKKAGGDAGANDMDGRAPMHWAARNGHGEVIKALKEVGAEVMVKDRVGRTPMDWALEKGHIVAIDALKET